MIHLKRATCLGSALLIALAVGGRSYAAEIDYGDLAGANVTFLDVIEASITDGLPLYGAPTVSGDTLQFDPTFLSSSSGGTADTTSGTLALDVIVGPGLYLQKIVLTETFESLFIGAPSDGLTAASINGAMVAVDLTPGHGLQLLDPQALVVTGGSPILPSVWNTPTASSASVELDLRGLGVTAIGLTYNNNLQTISDVTSSSQIQKTAINLQIITPEPASLALLALGALAVVGRPRRARQVS